MQYAIQLFQVTGAAIPTLMVAAAITARVSASWVETFTASSRFGKIWTIAYALYVFAYALIGELASLGVLAHGGPGNSTAGRLATGGTITLFSLIALELVMPMIKVFKGVGVAYMALGIFFVTLVAGFFGSLWM